MKLFKGIVPREGCDVGMYIPRLLLLCLCVCVCVHVMRGYAFEYIGVCV